MLNFKNGAPDRDTVIVGDFAATDAATQPDGVTFRQCVVQAGAKGGHRAFALHGKNLSILESRVLNFFEIGRESQAVWIHNGPGPYLVENNYLEASGENIITGGDTINIPNCIPSNVTIRGNHCFKPDSWRPVVGQPVIVVKNCIELKM